MIDKWYAELSDGVNVKENLLKIKDELRKLGREGKSVAVRKKYSSFADRFLGLLKDEDPKNRKNAAQVLGEIGTEASLNGLLSALSTEDIRYVRVAILEAVESTGLDDSSRETLSQILSETDIEQVDADSKKHAVEEKKLILGMLGKGPERHSFTGLKCESELVLVTNRNHRHLTMDALQGIPRKEFNAGVMVKTDDLGPVLKCRLYEELLFVLPGAREVSDDPEDIAEKLFKGGIIEFLKERHEGEGSFAFRVTLKRKEPDERGRFVHRVSAAIEEFTGLFLMNDPDNYELEIRLIARSAGGYSVLLKLASVPDKRFVYRKEVVAASMRSYNAALFAALVKPYMAEEAVVMDPFCGVGTVLAERAFADRPKAIYAIDIFGQAVEKAKQNLSRIHGFPKTYFVNKDFFEFSVDHKIDEIMTDMPFAMGRTGASDIDTVYRRFFEKASEILAPSGKIFLYTHDEPLVKKYTRGDTFRIVSEFEISMKEGTYVCVLERREAV